MAILLSFGEIAEMKDYAGRGNLQCVCVPRRDSEEKTYQYGSGTAEKMEFPLIAQTHNS
jgi:hypothetical protein